MGICFMSQGAQTGAHQPRGVGWGRDMGGAVQRGRGHMDTYG